MPACCPCRCGGGAAAPHSAAAPRRASRPSSARHRPPHPPRGCRPWTRRGWTGASASSAPGPLPAASAGAAVPQCHARARRGPRRRRTPPRAATSWVRSAARVARGAHLARHPARHLPPLPGTTGPSHPRPSRRVA
eukprot:scaffold49899_cov63-Phaeocystis_antarctica.AAC.1